jgi:hypothetical protein
MAENNSSESLHKIPAAAAVSVQYVKCGKSNCRCANGALHGPYYAKLWKVNGRMRKAYVRLKEVENAQADWEKKRQERRQRKEFEKSLRGLNKLCKGVRGLISSKCERH